MRQIFLDTETTGLSPESGDRIIEIGCVELMARKLTGNNKHFYLNPDRESHEAAFKVHGISDEFLKDKPRFEPIPVMLRAMPLKEESFQDRKRPALPFQSVRRSHVRYRIPTNCSGPPNPVGSYSGASGVIVPERRRRCGRAASP